ncbi:MAG TPA: TIM barrel protein [Ktedonobacteraceae bacterium]
MSAIHIANAPCSWGTLEFAGLEGERIEYSQMLNELRATGYTGTELGDWGYMPSEPGELKRELLSRSLAMVGAFVPVALKDADAHAQGEVHALRVARLLAGVVESAGDFSSPVLVLADDNGLDQQRTLFAGRVIPQMGLSPAEWRTFARGAERIAHAVREETGLRTAFHHHCAGYVETPAEIARLLELTDPDLLGLVFDTGHYLYGSGQSASAVVVEGLERFHSRIWHIHLKDCQPQIAARARQEGWDYFTALQHGIFCELGQGAVPFAEIAAALRRYAYHGWMVVEQDILPGMGSPRASAQRNRTYLHAIGL